MKRTIDGFQCDDEGDWVAELSCGHGQHVRNRPPSQVRAWVLDADGRRTRIGTSVDCPRCDRAELPNGLRLVRSSPEWDEHTIPAGLRRTHRLAAGTWGRIEVRDGQLRFTARTEPPLDLVLGHGSTQAIPPEIEHDVQPLGTVRFSIQFLTTRQRTRDTATVEGDEETTTGIANPLQSSDEGGEAACWAHLLCPECEAVLDAGLHGQGCSLSVHP